MTGDIQTDKTNTDIPVIDQTGCCYDQTRDIKIYNCTISEDLSNISGYTEEGTKAKYIISDKRWYYGPEISRLNLIDFSQRDKEYHLQMSSKGGKATQENIHIKRTLNEIAKQMLDQEISKSNVEEILGDSIELTGGDYTAGAVMIAKMIQTACAGSFKAAEFVRDTAGYKPKNEVELNADIITDADRSLLDKIDKRLTG